MFSLPTRIRRIAIAAAICGLLTGCSQGIKYNLTPETAPPSAQPARLNVAVVPLDDARENVEKQKSDREARGDEDAGDYTYDKDFKGNVAPSISEMMAGHLTFTGAFEEVHFVDAETGVSQATLDSLNRQGVDAVLTGKVENFYGYYDQSPGKKTLAQLGLGLALALPVAILTTSTETSSVPGGQVQEVKTSPLAIGLAAGVGVALGTFIESNSSRDIAWHTRLSLELVSTGTGETLWTGTSEVQNQEHKSMPGVNTNNRKQQVALSSLKDAINGLVDQLARANLTLAATDSEASGR